MKIGIAVAVVLLLWPAMSCGGANQCAVKAALERGDVKAAVSAYNRMGEPESALLARIAAALLREEALGRDRVRQQAALGQLAAAGARGRGLLQQLADKAADNSGPAALAGARALGLLAGRGDADAVDRLRELVNAEQTEVRAAAVSVLQPVEDLGRLLAELDSPYPSVRLAAARALGSANRNTPSSRENGPPLPAARIALEKCTRLDPAAEVRAAALWSLAEAGRQAAESIEQALDDAEREVRLAAIGALVLADVERAELVLGRLMQSDLGEEGIAAARHLLAMNDDRGGADPTKDSGAVAEAQRYLRRALAATEPTLRAAAAVAVDALPPERFDSGWLIERVEREKVPRVRLSLVNALWTGSEQGRLRGALREIGATGGVSGAYAIALLAEQGDPKAVDKLCSLLARAPVAVKRVAAQVLGRDLGRPHLVRRALGDSDALVRIAAAGAVLAAAG